MVYDSITALRHIPKQSRGQRKVEHILRSAEELFARDGFEHTTTNAIAAHAGVSIGSLYQFFASKDAILSAIADRYLEQTRLALSKALTPAKSVRLEVWLSGLLELLVSLQEQRPYFLQCLSRSLPSPALIPSVARLNDAVTAQVATLLERSTTEANPQLLVMRAQICVQTIGALMPMALHARGRRRSLVIRETVTVLSCYLEPSLRVKGWL